MPNPNMFLLDQLRQSIGEHLADIADMLDPAYKITLVARFPGDRLKTVIVSDDDCILAAAELTNPADDLVTVKP
jgi:hypothetical protein